MAAPSLAQRQHMLDGVVVELAAERAASMGRAIAKLERTLNALSSVDVSSRDAHQQALRRSANALWELVVHREACGVPTDVHELARDYGVPESVVSRMGPFSE